MIEIPLTSALRWCLDVAVRGSVWLVVVLVVVLWVWLGVELKESNAHARRTHKEQSKKTRQHCCSWGRIRLERNFWGKICRWFRSCADYKWGLQEFVWEGRWKMWDHCEMGSLVRYSGCRATPGIFGRSGWYYLHWVTIAQARIRTKRNDRKIMTRTDYNNSIT